MSFKTLSHNTGAGKTDYSPILHTHAHILYDQLLSTSFVVFVFRRSQEHPSLPRAEQNEGLLLYGEPGSGGGVPNQNHREVVMVRDLRRSSHSIVAVSRCRAQCCSATRPHSSVLCVCVCVGGREVRGGCDVEHRKEGLRSFCAVVPCKDGL